MKLKILKDGKKEMIDDTVVLSVDYLKHKSTHFFLASNEWEEVYLELNDDIAVEPLKYIGALCNNIKVKLPYEVTETTVHQLTHLYPHLAGKLRSNFLRVHDVKGVLGSCLVI